MQKGPPSGLRVLERERVPANVDLRKA